MKHIYFAPMEGITTVTYRSVFRRHFSGVDRYFTPFLVANQNHRFKKRERQEVLPLQDHVVPQVLANSAEDFIWAVEELAAWGYEEVNLNLGCPAATVVTKGKGAGLLADLDKLEHFFDAVFACRDLPNISIKTRIGMTDPKEADLLTELFANYPFSEVIIHPRLREEFYGNTPHLEVFGMMKEQLSCPVCYNGDLCTPEDVQAFFEQFPDVDTVMIGRGLLANPALAREIGGAASLKREELMDFLQDLQERYQEILSGDRDVLFKLKELWFYIGRLFPDQERKLRDVKRAKKISEYETAVHAILDDM